MRIIQLDETQTDISTRAHFHPPAIRLYGQHGFNAAGPTGSGVRQASPPPPKPLLSPIHTFFFFHRSARLPLPHTYTHFSQLPALPVNNKPPGVDKYRQFFFFTFSEKMLVVNYASLTAHDWKHHIGCNHGCVCFQILQISILLRLKKKEKKK